jgi:hypothetical protein
MGSKLEFTNKSVLKILIVKLFTTNVKVKFQKLKKPKQY